MRKHGMILFTFLLLLYSSSCFALSPKTVFQIPEFLLTPLNAPAASDFIESSLSRYEPLFRPFSETTEDLLQKRFIHMKKVMEMYYYFVREDYTSLFNSIPDRLKDCDFETYSALMKTLKSEFDSLTPAEQITLQEATLLHDVGFIGKNWTHNQRGCALALKHLKETPLAPLAEPVSSLILQHGDWSDIGVDSFPGEVFSKSISEQIQIMLITFFDTAGKITGNIMNASKIKTALELKSTVNKNPSGFYLYRFQHLLSPNVFSDLGKGKQEMIQKWIDDLFREASPEETAGYMDHWNSQIKVFVFPLFQGLYEPSKPEESMYLFLKFTKIISQMVSVIQAKNPLLKEIVIDTDFDFMILPDAQRTPYLDFLKHWVSHFDISPALMAETMKTSPCLVMGLPLSYDSEKGILSLDLSKRMDLSSKQTSSAA